MAWETIVSEAVLVYAVFVRAFLAEVASRSPYFKAIPKYLTALDEAKIDFPKEVLVLLRHTEGSISTQMQQGPTTLSPSSDAKPLRNLTFRLRDETYRDYPVVVDTSLVDIVSLEVDGQETYSVNLSKAVES